MIYKEFQPLPASELKQRTKSDLIRHIGKSYEAIYDLLLYIYDEDEAEKYRALDPLMMDYVRTLHDLKWRKDDGSA